MLYTYTYKYRLYPNKEQQVKIIKNFGCKRFVYNHFLDMKIKEYETNKNTLKKYDLIKMIPNLKSQYEWLKEVDSISLQQALFDMDEAFKNFFKYKRGYPKFKKKGYYDSYRTNNVNNSIKIIDKNHIQIPKLGRVKFKQSKLIDSKTIIKSVTLSQKPSGKYYISILVETNNNNIVNSSNLTGKKIGLDFGMKDNVFLTDNEGNKIYGININKNYEKKLEILYQRLSNKKKGSKNREKARIKLAKFYEHIENKKNDYLHKLTSDLVKEYDVIVIEDLSVNDMLTDNTNGLTNKISHSINKKLMNLSFHKFKTMLEYKCQRYNNNYNKKLVKANKYYKSSQTCSVCGYINKNVKDLTVRTWLCPNCNTYHDRDVNAAKNLVKLAIQ